MNRKKTSGLLQQLVFVGPSTLFFTVIIVIPFLLGLYYSFTSWNGVSGEVTWVGIDNFKQILTKDPDFGKAFWFTVRFTVIGIILTNLLGFFLAYFLTKPLKTRNVLRTVFFMPNVIGGLLLGFIWQFIFVKGFAAVGSATKLAFLQSALAWRCDDRLLGHRDRVRLANRGLFDGHLHFVDQQHSEGHHRSGGNRRGQQAANFENGHYAAGHA